MRTTILSIATVILGSFLTLYGTLLAWNPDLFLKFHDTFVDRSKWNKNAEWRKSINTVEWKVAAAGFVGVGMFIVFQAVLRLL
jgi:hypothetical protein